MPDWAAVAPHMYLTPLINTLQSFFVYQSAYLCATGAVPVLPEDTTCLLIHCLTCDTASQDIALSSYPASKRCAWGEKVFKYKMRQYDSVLKKKKKKKSRPGKKQPLKEHPDTALILCLSLTVWRWRTLSWDLRCWEDCLWSSGLSRTYAVHLLLWSMCLIALELSKTVLLCYKPVYTFQTRNKIKDKLKQNLLTV